MKVDRVAFQPNRERILAATVLAVCDRGLARASVTDVCARAKVSRHTFYELYDSLDDCFRAVLDRGYECIVLLISRAFERARAEQEGQAATLAGLRGALVALLSFFDSEPQLARVWLIESLAAGGWALELRERRVASLGQMIFDEWSDIAGAAAMPPCAHTAVMSSVLGIVQTHLIMKRPQPLLSLLAQLMGVVATPYIERTAVAREMERARRLAGELSRGRTNGESTRPVEQPAAELPPALRHQKAHRARLCLLHVAGHPGASNRQIADAVEIRSHTQISTLLARLADEGLLVKQVGDPGHANAWRLTEYGRQVAVRLRAMSRMGFSLPTHI